MTGDSSGDLLGVCYGEALCVAVGKNGAIYTSETGENWGSQISGTTAVLRSVTHGSGSFVAVGDGGTVLYSLDGTNWTAAASNTTTNLGSVRFGNGIFVAVGSRISLTSEDGVSWLPHQMGYVYYYNSAFGNGVFLAEGSAGTNWVSSDGVSWIEFASGTSSGAGGMGFGGEVFMIVDKAGRTITSPDGVYWNARSPVPIVRAAGVAYGSGYYVTVGAGEAAYSRDGQEWRAAEARLTPRDVCYANGTFVAVGYGERILQSDLVVWLGQQSQGVLEIVGPVGKTCGIEARERLGVGGGWNVLTNFTLMTNPHMWLEPLETNAAARLYRAVVYP